jgi:hypothetical protein
VNGTNAEGEPDLRLQRNAALGVSIAALVLPVVEAILVGQIAGE